VHKKIEFDTSKCIKYFNFMHTAIDIPEELFLEAQSILGFKSKTDVVIYSLQEVYIRLTKSKILFLK